MPTDPPAAEIDRLPPADHHVHGGSAASRLGRACALLSGYLAAVGHRAAPG